MALESPGALPGYLNTLQADLSEVLAKENA